MIEKNPRIKDNILLRRYAIENPLCELCEADNSLDYECLSDVHTHHILPGDNRTDEKWNIIRLGKKHHDKCTPHHAEGKDHKYWNQKCVIIKIAKGELKMSMIKNKDRKRLINNLLEYEVNNEK